MAPWLAGFDAASHPMQVNRVTWSQSQLKPFSADLLLYAEKKFLKILSSDPSPSQMYCHTMILIYNFRRKKQIEMDLKYGSGR